MLENHLADHLAEQLYHRDGYRPSPGERRSWERSIPRLVADLVDAGRPKVEILVEYQLPYSSKRADVVLAGRSARTDEPRYLVVELKQWTQARPFEDSDVLVEIEAYGHRPVTHPVDQVAGYTQYLQDFVAVLAERPSAVSGVAYLHNATDLGVAGLLTRRVVGDGRMFTADRRAEFHDFLAGYFSEESGAAAADELLGSKISPSKKLMTVAADEVQRREMFVLLDEQRDAYEYVRHAVNSARRANTKTAVVVSGGPGSGKSVIALSLMGQLAREGRTVMHATGSQSFTETLRKVAGRGNTRVARTFKYFNSFMNVDANDLDVLILDEAHRIREQSANRFTAKKDRTGRPQIDELLAAARTPVFLLDQDQVVRPGELGTVEDITAAARAHGMDVLRVSLDDQFRCGGSLTYVRWVQSLLGLAPGGPTVWDGEDPFEVHVMPSPQAMYEWLARHNHDGFTARLTAGFCWRWSDPKPDRTLVDDVRIGDWAMPWNVKTDRRIGDAPPKSLWASDPGGFGQVGCVYTAQGFEYDYAGVILGPDLVRRGDRWFTDRTASKDPAITRGKSVTDEEVDRLIRNVYKVLLTRGMLGVALYSTDPETQEFLRSLVR